MPATSPATLPARVPPRTALLSILAFWLFYFAVATGRTYAMWFGRPSGMIGGRLLVCLGGIAISYALYLILRRTAALALGIAITVAAIACVPAAIGYASVNWYVFRGVNRENRVVIRHRTDPKAVAISVGGDPREIEMTPVAMIADTAMSGYFFLMAWCAFYFALAYAAAVREAERRAAGFRAAAQAAELRALRYQVSPHFLFNTLNSLSSLVLQGQRDEAERMIQTLSTFFRTSLTGDGAADVTLAEEIGLQRLYLAIEAVRFRDRLAVAIDVPEGLNDACVPGLILQPLVENAIKHGVSRTARPVRLAIRAEEAAGRLVLRVTDDADAHPEGGDAAPVGTGVGLANVCDRLAARYGGAAECRHGAIDAGGYAVTLTMPLVRHGD